MAAVAIAAVGGITTGAVAAPGPGHVHAHVAAASPTLHATISKHGLKLKGDRSIQASRVTVSLKAVGKERELAIARFKKGYSFKKLVRDETYFFTHTKKDGSPTKKALKRLDHVITVATFAGGLDVQPGQTAKETLVMSKGKYVVFNDSNIPSQPQTITVTGATHHAKSPKTSATVFMKKNQNRFGGSKVLPAKGTIKVVNHNVNSPHFLVMLHVKKGTTRKQVEEGLQSPNPPSFALPGGIGTDALSMGQSQTLTYSIPKGTYAQLCFFPDPMTGIPHAFMGMIRIVTVK
jgi:hypothetical protein